jgi:diadenosine tetraphosphatase ApaH/serine/threonine PP2A family protein phosphatase
MKIAVITDLHANREAVQAVLEHAAAHGAKHHAFVGDFVGYGADPAWVVDRIRELVEQGAVAVMGNHDAAVAQAASRTMRADARFVVDWTRERLDAAQLEFLARLPLTHERGDLLFVHANAFDPPAWAYIEGKSEAVRSMQATRRRITFCGHMHEPMLYHLSATGRSGSFLPTAGEAIPLLASRRWLVIPGAAGQPRDGNPAACYALYDEDAAQLTYWRVPYDHDAAMAKIHDAGLPQSLAARLADGH